MRRIVLALLASAASSSRWPPSLEASTVSA